jgi:hypothetical protein
MHKTDTGGVATCPPKVVDLIWRTARQRAAGASQTGRDSI